MQTTFASKLVDRAALRELAEHRQTMSPCVQVLRVLRVRRRHGTWLSDDRQRVRGQEVQEVLPHRVHSIVVHARLAHVRRGDEVGLADLRLCSCECSQLPTLHAKANLFIPLRKLTFALTMCDGIMGQKKASGV